MSGAATVDQRAVADDARKTICSLSD